MKKNRYTYLLVLLGVLSGVRTVAQGICASGALAPVFKQTFGTSPSSATKTTVPSGFITNYAFNGSSTLSDGQYMVTPLVQNSQKNDWAVGGDHTGDLNGNMFLVNAGTGASLFFQQQVNNLCPGSTFSFSAWLANVNTISNTQSICGAGYVYPNVTFYIKDTNGNVLQSYNTGNLPFTADRIVAPNWMQYGFQFTLPAGVTSLVLEMADYYGGLPQCGNDLAIDDIVFSACTPQASITLSTAGTLCAGSNTTISSSLVNSPFTTPAYQWQKSNNGGIPWSNIGTAGTSATTFPLTNLSVSDGGVYRVLVGPDISSLSSNTCVTASNTITLTVNALPAVSVSSNSPVCITNRLDLASAVSGGITPYDYNWTGPSLTSTIANPSILNAVLVNAGTYSLTVTDANGCSSTGSTNVAVNSIGSTSNAGIDQLLCNTSSATLNGNTATLGLGLWTQTAGPNTAGFTNNLQNNTSVTGLVSGTYQFTWSITNFPCPVSSSSVQVIISPPTVAGTLSGAATVCYGSNSGSLSLAGNNGVVIQWEFSTDGGASWSVISNTTNTNNYTNLSATTLYRVLVQSGSCATQYSNSITVTVSQPTVGGTLSSNATVCISSNNGTLSLTGNTGNIIQWESSVDGGASWSVITNTNNTCAYSNLVNTTVYRVLVQSSPCIAQYSNTVTITVSQPTVAGTLSGSSTVCASSNTGTLTLSGSNGTIIQWESSGDGGVSWFIISNTNSFYTYHNLAATTIYRVLLQNGPCATAYSNMVTVTVDPATVPGLLSANTVVCAASNNGTLSLLSNNGTILQWEFSVNNGISWSVIPNTANSYTYHNVPVKTLYRVLVQSGVCGPSYSNTVTIDVAYAVTPANAGNDQIFCNAGSAILSANIPVTGSGAWSVASGPYPLSFTNYTSGNSAIAGLRTGTYQLVWTISNQVCPDSKDTVAIIINPPINNLTDTARQIVCNGQSITINGQLPTGGNGSYQYQWQQSFNGNTWTDINGATGMSYTFVPASNVFIKRAATSLPCTSVSGVTIITVQQSLSNNIISGDRSICFGAGSQTITGSLPSGGDNVYTYQWEQSTDAGRTWTIVNNADSRNLVTAAISTTTSFHRIVTTQLCTGSFSSTSNAVTISVKPVLSVSIQYKGGTYCGLQNDVIFTAVTNNTDSIRWRFGDGTTLVTASQKISHTYTSAGIFVPQLDLININTGCTLPVTAGDTIRIDDVRAGFKLSAVYDCGKTTYRYTDTSFSYFPVSDRLWTINQTQSIGGREEEQVFTSAGARETGLRVRTIYGCSSSLQAKFNVAIYNYPQVNIDAIGQACMNNLIQLKSVINSADSVKARFWNLGNGAIATDSVVEVSYFSEGKYIVKLTVGTVNSCYDSAMKQINIHPAPKINVTADKTLCRGDSLELKADGALSYIWKDQNDSVLCNSCVRVKIVPQKTMQYKVIGYSEYGCSEIGTTNVRVIQPLQLVAQAEDSICVGMTKRLFVSGADSYTWDPNPTLSSYSIASPYASPVENTTYRVIGKDSYNCFADTAEIKITVGGPTPVFVGTDTAILAGEPVQLHAVAGTNNIRKWQWKGNATFSCINCASPTAKVINNECLSCSATNSYGCVSTDTVCITTFCTGSEVFIPNAFSPDGDGINDVLFVQGRGIRMIKSFRIYSRWGEMVFEKTNFQPGDRSSGWDGRVRGKLASPDVFVYVCEAICEKGVPAIFKGNTAIIK